MAQDERICDKVYIESEVAQELDLRQHETGAINVGLKRFYYLLAETREKLAHRFSSGEAGFMLSVMNDGRYNDPILSCDSLLCNLDDVVKNEGYRVEAFGIDGEKLLAKLNDLDTLSIMTLVDAIERWWNGPLNEREFLELLIAPTPLTKQLCDAKRGFSLV